jgi:hypothetical protein
MTSSGRVGRITVKLKPDKGGFLRPFGCGQFIREFLLGSGPNGSRTIDPVEGAPQAEIFHHYKMALMKATALDRATKLEEKRAKKEKRVIDPGNIQELADKYLGRMAYKTRGCRYHSFVVYFGMLQKLGWVEPAGKEEPSSFQEHYPLGPPRRYYRLTKAGRKADETAWANPHFTLYGSG